MSEPDPTTTAAARATAKRPRANAAGSTAKVRGEVLTALGVLKAVTADQLWRLLRPAATENKFARAALNDLPRADARPRHLERLCRPPPPVRRAAHAWTRSPNR